MIPPKSHVVCPGCSHSFPAESEETNNRDHCAVAALTRALQYLGFAPMVADAGGNLALTQRGQDIEYIRMTLALYDDLGRDQTKKI